MDERIYIYIYIYVVEVALYLNQQQQKRKKITCGKTEWPFELRLITRLLPYFLRDTFRTLFTHQTKPNESQSKMIRTDSFEGSFCEEKPQLTKVLKLHTALVFILEQLISWGLLSSIDSSHFFWLILTDLSLGSYHCLDQHIYSMWSCPVCHYSALVFILYVCNKLSYQLPQ